MGLFGASPQWGRACVDRSSRRARFARRRQRPDRARCTDRDAAPADRRPDGRHDAQAAGDDRGHRSGRDRPRQAHLRQAACVEADRGGDPARGGAARSGAGEYDDTGDRDGCIGLQLCRRHLGRQSSIQPAGRDAGSVPDQGEQRRRDRVAAQPRRVWRRARRRRGGRRQWRRHRCGNGQWQLRRRE